MDGAVNRIEWQLLAEEKMRDAEALLAAGRWSAAYYLSGYAVECGLKSCILSYVANTPEAIFKDKRYSERCWTHNLEELVRLGGLENALKADVANSPALDKNWSVAKEWDELSRYQQKDEGFARELFEAISDTTSGVLPWIRTYW
jgi:HEPN domain-containing protein